MKEPEAFPWDEAAAFAFAVLRLSPGQFWAMTPRELALAMRPFLHGRGAPGRAQFDALCKQFPDLEN